MTCPQQLQVALEEKCFIDFFIREPLAFRRDLFVAQIMVQVEERGELRVWGFCPSRL